MADPLVSVVILNFNGKEYLGACLKAVVAQSCSSFEVIVVDNNSTDGSHEIVKEFPSVRLIRSEINLGFAGGNNLGVTHAKGDLIVLLNNDTTVDSSWLQTLVDGASSEHVAVASSFVRTKGVPERDYERNGSINLLGHNIMRIFSDPQELFYAGGTSMVFRRSLIGLPFDDLYFAYSEDVYCSLRARFMGYQIRQVPESVVHHVGGGSFRKVPSPRVTMLQERNRLLTIALFFSWWTLLRLIPLFLVNILAKMAMAFFAQRYSVVGLLKAYSWFAFHPGLILTKRKKLQGEARVHEREILSHMTGCLTNGESRAGRLVNSLSVLYCRLMGIVTIEIARGNRK